MPQLREELNIIHNANHPLAAVISHAVLMEVAVECADHVGSSRDRRGDNKIVLGIARNYSRQKRRQKDDRRAACNTRKEFRDIDVSSLVHATHRVIPQYPGQLFE
jgi:hypothetical protein